MAVFVALGALPATLGSWSLSIPCAAKNGCGAPAGPSSIGSEHGGFAMRYHTDYRTFKTKRHREYVNITQEVDHVLSDSGIQEGMVLVCAMHITAGVYVNDAESGLLQDIDTWLEQLAPSGPDYHHHRTGETNGDAHLKNLLIGHQVLVPVTKGCLDLGPWQQIYYAEFDGQRSKQLIIKVMGD